MITQVGIVDVVGKFSCLSPRPAIQTFACVPVFEIKKEGDNEEFVNFNAVPPTIVDADSSASHITVREGLRATLTCRGDGVPPPRVTWRREDGRPILIGEKKKEGDDSLFFLNDQKIHTSSF